MSSLKAARLQECLELEALITVTSGDGQDLLDRPDVVGVVPERHGTGDPQAQPGPGRVVHVVELGQRRLGDGAGLEEVELLRLHLGTCVGRPSVSVPRYAMVR